jgi:hypothetical protein
MFALTLGCGNNLEMPNNDNSSLAAGNEWDTQRAWNVVVKLAEAHQELQASHNLLLSLNMTDLLRDPDATDLAAEKDDLLRR